MAVLDRLRRVTTMEALQDVLYPKDLFLGYEGREEVYATVQRKLAAIVESRSTYLDIRCNAA